MKKISILGSTGSIGRQSLEVARLLRLEVEAISAYRDIDRLEAQAREFKPKIAAVYDEKAAAELKTRLADTETRVISGMEGLIETAAGTDAEAVVTAVVGTVGLKPTMAAIAEKKRIALANKETLVCAGRIVMEAADRFGAEILPVDSEHSAIFQCLMGNRVKYIKRILLTASGGPFRGKKAYELENVTAEDALAHPTWSMGSKITVDSATLMNKGQELIEAMHLFKVPPERIKVLIHPQSIVHSMVEYTDNSIIAQLGVPDMRLPIQFALTYPERLPSLEREMDFVSSAPLTFEEPDTEAFKCLPLAVDCAARDDAACAVMSAANEEAVGLFLKGSIGFMRIYEVVARAVDRLGGMSAETVEDILAADAEARIFVRKA
ncbi:MAG: 1-deoxy-D-xylulose-5-phosphate reductoisomerase [Oscillospiraceae bacterium]|nr:1-deoxy-D-xylulose-5-phosphate reductoisomerase [Oscillospiraceae bacterium]